MPAIVQRLGWLVCVVYSTIPLFWLLIHSRTEYWRARRRSPYRVLMPVWLGMWAVAALVTALWRGLAFYQNIRMWLPALALFALGIWLYARSGANFSTKQLSGIPEMRPGETEQRLVTVGIRARVRHPVYLAHLCEMLAWSVGTGLAVCFALTAFAVVTGAIMIRAEDAELERRFGEAYRVYRESVPAIVPRLGRADVRL
jgi:protein-S-isoprenylcysteine O-methyltransferase Ste14